ncbi:MAG: hypothetical protein MUO82_00210 [Candidatus Thermoplasmatota archaeon]|nr:hypothetical protein [Candidatus Thermoplasmatota archaeon]
MKRIILFIIICILLSPTSFFTIGIVNADSNNYYVSTTGDNANDGSLESPWKTIEYAVTQTSSGDTINIMEGVYTPSAGQILISNKNTASQWYTIQNYNDDLVIIDGTNCPKTNYINATIEVRNSKYLRITGLTVNHSAKGGITLMATPCSFIRIDNCTISNSSSFAFKVVSGMNNITFEYNYVYNNFNNWSHTLMSQETISFEHVTTFSINHIIYKENHAGSIDMKGGCSRGVVCYNDINTTGGYVVKGATGDWGGPGIMLDARGISHNISIYNNKVYGNVTGISLNTETTGHYEYIYIYNNVVNITNENNQAPTDNGRTPIGLGNTGSSQDIFHNIYIYSNTVIAGANNGASPFKVGHYSRNQLNSNNLQEVYVVNNIFYGYYTASGYAIWEINKISFEDGVFIVNNNSFYRPSGTIRIYWNGLYYSSSANPEKFGDEPVFTNPLFVNRFAGNFHLNSTSPCKDTGNNILVPCFDFDDVYRPQGSGYDIGTFEYLSESDTIPPQISAISLISSDPLDTDPSFGWVNVSCTVMDNVAVSQVILRIHNPSGSWNNVTMITTSNGKYYYRTTTAFSTAGNYSYTIWAKDTSNNVKTSYSVLYSMPPNWDINNDGVCKILDIVHVSIQFGSTGIPGWIREDVDNNGVINVLDISLVSNHFWKHWYI